MKPTNRTLAAIATAAVAMTVAANAATDALAPPGAKATMTVDYLYTANGKKTTGSDEFHEWKVRRSVNIVAELVAQKPTAVGTQGMDAEQTATLNKQVAQANKSAKQMAPMMAGAEAIVAKCGDDENCLEREAMKMGAAMAGTKELDDNLKAGRETAAVMQPGAAMIQMWLGASQTGSYSIDESYRGVEADPRCVTKNRARCIYDMQRAGRGEIPAMPGKLGGGGAVEVDLRRNLLALRLPAPLALPYLGTRSNNRPLEAGEVSATQGPTPYQLTFRTTADGNMSGKPMVVPLEGGWRSQSGEQVIQMQGERGEGGTLNVRWSFQVK